MESLHDGVKAARGSEAPHYGAKAAACGVCINPRLRESEYNRGTGCGKTARPGLCGGRPVTGAPTARGIGFDGFKREVLS